MSFGDLPLEIIQYIFSLCCQTLSLVCLRWREIALNTSMLWGDVAVFYEADRERALGPTAPFQCVQIWLNRAGMTPISLSISVNEALESQIAAISQTLLSSFHVTNLHLESSIHSLLLVPTNNSSRLERLHLSLYEPARTTDIFPRLPEMPSLKELRLCLHPRDVADLTNIYTIPWHQLRVFTLSEHYWSSQMLFNILQRCTSLVECTLLVKVEYGQHENDIVLPNMESLVLDIKLGDCADPFIRWLTLPNLKSLEITSWNRYSKLPVSPEAIVIMAQRSGFNRCLTYFSLSQTEQPVDVRWLLGSLPALKSVKLFGPLMFQPGTFDDLSSGTIGPQVEEIFFGVMSDEEITLLLETVGQRHEKAKIVSDIRPFAFVTGQCTSESDLESHKQQAAQCGEAFNVHVAIFRTPEVLRLLAGMIWDLGDSDPDFSMGSSSDEESYIDEELGSIPDVVFVSDEEPLEESSSGEESHLFGEPESDEEPYLLEDSSSESHLESDPDVSSDSHSGDESDPDDDVQSDV